jgi:hypothetical protein
MTMTTMHTPTHEDDSPERTLRALAAFGLCEDGRACTCPAPRLFDIGKPRRCCYECYGWEPTEE